MNRVTCFQSSVNFSSVSPTIKSLSSQALDMERIKKDSLNIRVYQISNDTLDDAEDRFWSEFCTSPKLLSNSTVNGNSQNRLLQVLQHLNKKS